MKKIYFLIFIFSFFIWFFYDYNWFFYYKIPLKLDYYCECPCVSAQIEGNLYALELDLGSRMPLSLQARVLEKIQKKGNGVARRLDFRGNKYETPRYIIPSASLYGFSIHEVDADEEARSFRSATLIFDPFKRNEEERTFQYFGRLGLGFFLQHNFLFDFSRLCLIVCRDIQDLQREGYDLKYFISGPLNLTSCGVVLNVETDSGQMRLLVDTGSTDTIIRSSFFEKQNYDRYYAGMPIVSTSKFGINRVDFGWVDMCLIDMAPRIAEVCDGLLGMDFLKTYPVFFDFKKQLFYIYVPSITPIEPEESGMCQEDSSES